jgi:hypothetical protein
MTLFMEDNLEFKEGSNLDFTTIQKEGRENVKNIMCMKKKLDKFS